MALFRFLLFSWFVKYPFVPESMYNYLSGANAGRSSSHIPVGAPWDLRSFERAPQSDDAERVFRARWTAWRDSRVAVAARIGPDAGELT